jgi:hypothetical protein
MAPGSKKHVDVARLKADLAAAGVELLSAHCATDRIRLQIFSAGHCCFRGTSLSPAGHCFRRGGLPLLFPNRGPHQPTG